MFGSHFSLFKRVGKVVKRPLLNSYHGQKNTHVGIRDGLVRGPSHLGRDTHRASGTVPRGPHHPTTRRRQGGDRLHVHDTPRRRLASRSSRLGKSRWAHPTRPCPCRAYEWTRSTTRPKPSITRSFHLPSVKSYANTQ